MQRRSSERLSRSVGFAEGPWQSKQFLYSRAECMRFIFGSLLWQTLQAAGAETGTRRAQSSDRNITVGFMKAVYTPRSLSGMIWIISFRGRGHGTAGRPAHPPEHPGLYRSTGHL